MSGDKFPRNYWQFELRGLPNCPFIGIARRIVERPKFWVELLTNADTRIDALTGLFNLCGSFLERSSGTSIHMGFHNCNKII